MALRGSYLAHGNIRHTAADAADSPVFAIRNPVGSNVVLILRRLYLPIGFDGTAAAATDVGYHVIRFTGGNPTTGDTVARIKKRSGMADSVVLDANCQRKSGILTITGASYESQPFIVFRVPASVTGAQRTEQLRDFMELLPGDGLAIRTHVAAIIGTFLDGAIEWDEKTL